MMRRTVQGMVLMLALSTPAYAGEMQTPRTSPTPAPPPVVEETGEPEAADSYTKTVLTVLQAVLALL